jgi:hypothetical protein
MRECWHDVLEPGRSYSVSPTNSQEFYRVLSRWSIRANLIEPNSEMGVVELGGRIHVLGGQTDTGSAFVDAVQGFDPATTNWSFRAPMPTARGGGAVLRQVFRLDGMFP